MNLSTLPTRARLLKTQFMEVELPVVAVIAHRQSDPIQISNTGTAMSRANVATAKRIYEARNRGDVDAVLAECDPEVTWHPHLATLGGNPIRGHDGVREYMASLQEDWVGFRHEPEDFIDAGDKVVALLNTFARGRGSGVDVEVPVAHILTFKAGKCLGYVSYHDRAEALRLAGVKE